MELKINTIRLVGGTNKTVLKLRKSPPQRHSNRGVFLHSNLALLFNKLLEYSSVFFFLVAVLHGLGRKQHTFGGGNWWHLEDEKTCVEIF